MTGCYVRHGPRRGHQRQRRDSSPSREFRSGHAAWQWTSQPAAETLVSSEEPIEVHAGAETEILEKVDKVLSG